VTGIIAVTDNTRVSIKLPVDRPVTVIWNNTTQYHETDTLVVDLNAFQTCQVQSQQDITGIYITSPVGHPLAVVSGGTTLTGSHVTVAPPSVQAGHAEEMIPPIRAWGQNFFVAPLGRRTVVKIIGGYNLLYRTV
jgi:hypothetical protein